MSRRWHGTPQQIAECVLSRVRTGEVRTAGEYVALVAVVNSLPARLRTWCWQQLKAELGSNAVDYLRTWQCSEAAMRVIS